MAQKNAFSLQAHPYVYCDNYQKGRCDKRIKKLFGGYRTVYNGNCGDNCKPYPNNMCPEYTEIEGTSSQWEDDRRAAAAESRNPRNPNGTLQKCYSCAHHSFSDVCLLRGMNVDSNFHCSLYCDSLEAEATAKTDMLKYRHLMEVYGDVRKK